MPKPITITKEVRKKALADFTQMLDSIKVFDGTFKYNKSYCYEVDNVTVCYTQEAYRKIVALVMEFDTEVGWHGTASRINDNEYLIDDILVYPQEVTGSTVKTDQAKFENWLYGELDDDTFNKIRTHGHSHVNMGVSPSSVDDTHRQKLVDQLEGDMFYIFSIWNKSLQAYTLVYDLKRNLLFDNDEIDVKMLGNESTNAFLTDAKEKVQKPTFMSYSEKFKGANHRALGMNKATTATHRHAVGMEGGYPWEF